MNGSASGTLAGKHMNYAQECFNTTRWDTFYSCTLTGRQFGGTNEIEMSQPAASIRSSAARRDIAALRMKSYENTTASAQSIPTPLVRMPGILSKDKNIAALCGLIDSVAVCVLRTIQCRAEAFHHELLCFTIPWFLIRVDLHCTVLREQFCFW
jgi:hypothetical protein